MKKLLLALAVAVPMVGCTVVEEQPARTTTVTRTVESNVYRPGYVVTDLPTGYRTVTVRRSTYFVDGNDVYYRRGPGGYVVVDRPL